MTIKWNEFNIHELIFTELSIKSDDKFRDIDDAHSGSLYIMGHIFNYNNQNNDVKLNYLIII